MGKYARRFGLKMSTSGDISLGNSHDRLQRDDSEVLASLQSTPTMAATLPNSYFDNSSLQITSHKLTGKNYLAWSWFVEMVVRGKGRYGYLDGAAKKPPESDPMFQTWDAQNSMVMAWLINSMDEKISETFMCYKTAQDMWEAARRQYSDLENSSQLFELRNRARNLMQSDMDVTTYFNSLSKLWQEVDLFNNGHWLCSQCSENHQKVINKERIYDFLAGLNQDLDVRGRLLGLKPLPNIEDIFAEVRREETRRRVMLGTIKSVPEFAFMTRGVDYQRNSRKELWCDHCQKPNHTKDQCWKLHGKPNNWENKKDGRGFQATSEIVTKTGESQNHPSFGQEQMEQLQQIINSQFASLNMTTNRSSHSGTSLLAQKGLDFGHEDWQ